MKILITIHDDQLANRLNLANRVLGGGATRSGMRGKIVRHLLDKHLPTEEELQAVIDYRRMSGWQRDKVKAPYIPTFVEKFNVERQRNMARDQPEPGCGKRKDSAAGE